MLSISGKISFISFKFSDIDPDLFAIPDTYNFNLKT